MEVADFYRGKSLFITGATGFMGKVLIEKLLRSCPDIKKIYLLSRPKGQLTAQQRIDALVDSELYARLRKEQPNFAEKLYPVNGELTKDNLGLSAEDLETLVNNVSIVFHIAATVKFTEKLKLAVELNIVAVKKIIKLCKSLKNCEALVHTSTAYAHTNRELIEEVIYPPAFDPDKLIDVVSALDVDVAEALTPSLVAERPNTYTFTKSLAEYVLKVEGQGLPIAIVRPSIVGSTWKEPFPGWVDNFNGPSGLAYAAGTGVLRVMPGDRHAVADIVPVDISINFMAVLPWYLATQVPDIRSREPLVFNNTTSGTSGHHWGLWLDVVTSAFSKYPLEKKIYRPPLFMFVSKSSYPWAKLIHHIIPAGISDVLLRLQGNKPMMLNMYDKLEKSLREYGFFTSATWKWEIKGTTTLAASMTEADRKRFDFDVTHLHWPTYIETTCIGIKKFLMREDMARVNIAKRMQRKLRIITLIMKVIGFAVIFKFLIPFLRQRGMLKSSWLLLAPVILMAKV